MLVLVGTGLCRVFTIGYVLYICTDYSGSSGCCVRACEVRRYSGTWNVVYEVFFSFLFFFFAFIFFWGLVLGLGLVEEKERKRKKEKEKKGRGRL